MNTYPNINKVHPIPNSYKTQPFISQCWPSHIHICRRTHCGHHHPRSCPSFHCWRSRRTIITGELCKGSACCRRRIRMPIDVYTCSFLRGLWVPDEAMREEHDTNDV